MWLGAIVVVIQMRNDEGLNEGIDNENYEKMWQIFEAQSSQDLINSGIEEDGRVKDGLHISEVW